MDNLPTWLNILLVLLTGSGGVAGLTVLGKRIRQWMNARAWHFGFREIHDVYAVLHALMAETAANRVLLLKAENNGGIPHAGGRLFSSVVYEVFSYPMESVRRSWQREELDRQYITLLTKVYDEGSAIIRSSRLPKESVLRDLYEAHGVKMSCIVKLGIANDENAFLYLSLAFHESNDDHDISESEREHIRAGVSRLRRLLNVKG